MAKNLNIKKMQELEKAMSYLIEAVIDILSLGGAQYQVAVDELRTLIKHSPVLEPDIIKRHAYGLAQAFFSCRKALEIKPEEEAAEEVQTAIAAPKADSPPYRELCSSIIQHLDGFHHTTEPDKAKRPLMMIEAGEKIEDVLRAILDLIIHVRETLLEERSRAFKHIGRILHSLEETERNFIKNIDSNHKYLNLHDAKFTADMESNLKELGTIIEQPEDAKFDVLFMHISEKVGSLNECLQRKKQHDIERLTLLSQERQAAEQRMAQSRRDYESFSRQSHEMLQEIETLRAVSLKDPLTEIYNRRAYDSQIIKTIDEVKKGTLKTCSMLVFDIDHFRDFNNTYGHLAGDKVLTYVARVTRDTLRADDLIFRYGGDEFVVIMPNATVDAAVLVGEKIRSAINSLEFKLSKSSQSTIRVTLSMGAAQIKNDDCPDSFFTRADKAMYTAKTCGRNQVCKADD